MSDGFRRIVTGHDLDGNARLASDAPPVRVVQIGGEAGATFHEIWHTRETPALIDRQSVGELVFLIGGYCLISMALNCLDAPVPATDAPA